MSNKSIGDVGQLNVLESLVFFLLQLPSRTGLNRELKLEVLKEAAQLGTIHILRNHLRKIGGVRKWAIFTYFHSYINA